MPPEAEEERLVELESAPGAETVAFSRIFV
jgi:hypothetical protein